MGPVSPGGAVGVARVERLHLAAHAAPVARSVVTAVGDGD
jgi:hypothetical protein